MAENTIPELRFNHNIKETLNHIKRTHSITVCHKIFTNLLSSSLRSLLRHFQERKHHNRKVSLKFLLSSLGHDLRSLKINAIKSFYSLGGCL